MATPASIFHISIDAGMINTKQILIQIVSIDKNSVSDDFNQI
jgi:hypothetical protein